MEVLVPLQWIQPAIRAYFLFSAKRKKRSSAERFLRKTLNATHTQTPRVVNVDKNAAIPPAVDKLNADEQLPEITELRLVLYLNNRVEQDHRFLCAADKTWNGMRVPLTQRARTLRGMEAMNMIRTKDKLKRLKKAMCDRR